MLRQLGLAHAGLLGEDQGDLAHLGVATQHNFVVSVLLAPVVFALDLVEHLRAALIRREENPPFAVAKPLPHQLLQLIAVEKVYATFNSHRLSPPSSI